MRTFPLPRPNSAPFLFLRLPSTPFLPDPRSSSFSIHLGHFYVRTYNDRETYIYIYAMRTAWLPSNQRLVIFAWVVGYGTCYDCNTRLNSAIFYLGLEKRIYSTIISRVFLRKAIMVSSTRAYLARFKRPASANKDKFEFVFVITNSEPFDSNDHRYYFLRFIFSICIFVKYK